MSKEERTHDVMKDREDTRKRVRKNILRLQEVNRKTYNKKRKKTLEHNIDDLMGIQRPQF